MSILDARTLSLVITITTILQAGVVIMLYRLAPRYHGVERWALSTILNIVSVVLITLRDYIPSFFSVVVANNLSLVGVALLVDGIARFLGRKALPWKIVAPLIGADFLAYYYWLSIAPNQIARVTLLFVLTALLYAYGAALLLVAPPVVRRAARFTGATFAVFAVWSILRDIVLVIVGSNGNDPATTPVNVLAPLVLLLFVLLSTIGLTALVLQRLLGDLQRQEQLFRLTFDQSPIGAAMLGLDTRFVRVNAALCQITGHTRDDLLVRTFVDLASTNNISFDIASVQQLRAGEIDLYSLEQHYIRPDGSMAWIALWMRMLREPSGAPLNYLALVEDITVRRQSEEDRRILERRTLELQKLESLVVMAGGVAHDFNNLLTAILGNAELVLADLPAVHPDRTSLEQIVTASLRAATLSKQMLAYAGRSNVAIAPVDINAVANDVAVVLPGLIPAQISIETVLSPCAPAILGDATQLRQALLSLVLNGTEAIGTASGSVSITTSIQELDRAFLQTTYLAPNLPEGFYAAIAVRDTGAGMDEATQAKIFEPFFTTKFTGRGLGLAAVLGIIRSHQGAIHVVSASQQGTTVTILLPLTASEQQEQIASCRSQMCQLR